MWMPAQVCPTTPAMKLIYSTPYSSLGSTDSWPMTSSLEWTSANSWPATPTPQRPVRHDAQRRALQRHPHSPGGRSGLAPTSPEADCAGCPALERHRVLLEQRAVHRGHGQRLRRVPIMTAAIGWPALVENFDGNPTAIIMLVAITIMMRVFAF